MEAITIVIAVLSLAFGLWAGVVYWIGSAIVQHLKEIGKDLKKEAEKLNQYIVQTEARLAVLEREHEIKNHQ